MQFCVYAHQKFINLSVKVSRSRRCSISALLFVSMSSSLFDCEEISHKVASARMSSSKLNTQLQDLACQSIFTSGKRHVTKVDVMIRLNGSQCFNTPFGRNVLSLISYFHCLHKASTFDAKHDIMRAKLQELVKLTDTISRVFLAARA
jgi:hypothetical protein